MKNYDLIIIGFGKAGKTLAAHAASHGQKVAVVEQSTKMYGGTCINIFVYRTRRIRRVLIIRVEIEAFEIKNHHTQKNVVAKIIKE